MQRKKRKLIAMPVVAVIIAIFFIAGAVSVFAAVDDYTVQGKNPQGTVVSLFDYWTNEQGSADYSPNVDLNSGINKNRDLKFNKGQGEGFNEWTGKGKGPYSGMVSNTLDNNGYPILKRNWINVFSPSSLDYLFNENDSTTEGSAKVEGKKAYTNVEGLMQVDDNGYYYYDCTKNFASYDSSTNAVKLYNKPGVYYRGTPGQFFPFSSGSDVFTESKGALNAKTNVDAESNDVNHWFGMSMSTHFMQSTNGKTNKGDDVTYEFSGDDDVWVFIDGVLVGDLGGIHDAASLNINFNSGVIKINGDSDGTLRSKYQAAGKENETQWSGNTFADGSYHTLKFFYLERGNFASNMSLKFNLKLLPDNELSKVDQYGSAVAGATFDLYEAEKKDDTYTKKGSSLCTGTTDAAGGLKLKAADGATINFEELYKKGIGPYYILEESQAPTGYRKAKDVWLRYDGTTGAITTDNMWESGIHANARIMITAPTHMYDRTGKQITASDGTLSRGSVFAVVYKRNSMDEGLSADSNWSAISGSALGGWKLQPVHNDNALEDVLQGNRYELKMNSMGAYETTLDELPGDIMTYSNVIVADNKGKSDAELSKALTDKARYSISYYYTTGSVENATASNTVRVDTGIMSKNPDAREFEYKYAVKLIVTDVSNDLYVRKFDEYSMGFNNQEHSVNGVKFALYKADQTTLLSRILPGDVKLKDDAVPVQEKTTADIISSQGSIDLYGTAIFRKLEKGTYYLKEISAPSGYKVKDNLIKVKVTDNGAFADAGEKGDGIYVGRGGSGTLLKSMEQFATNDDLDSTLTNMKINLRVSENEPNDDGTWDEEVSTAHQDPLHIKYTGLGEYSHVGHYKVYDSEANTTDELLNHMAFFTTDTGWPSVTLQQCREHDSGNAKATKTDLGDMDLSHLLVLESMVMVKDDTIGDLEISKTVKNDSSDTSFADKEFNFDVKLWGTTKDGDGNEVKSPVSGTFKYVVKGPAADDSETRELVVNEEGNATLQLKDGQTAVIKDLPASAQYEVTESTEDYWTVSSKVDDGEATASKTVTGTIPEPDDNGNKQKSTVAYENTYSPETASLDLPVEKRFNGWRLPGLKNREFSIRLTGLESTGEDIQNTMPDAVQDPQDGKWSITMSLGSGVSFPDSNGDVDTTEYITRNAEFSGLTFHKAGQYTYTIQEILVNDADINYSSALYEVLVTVTDDGSGHLTASYTMKKAREDDGTADDPVAETNGTAVFVNKYNLQTDVISLRAHKTYSNDTGSDTLTDGQFHFALEAMTEGAPMPESAIGGKVTAAANADGSVGFPEITYTTKEQGESFVYKISEVIPNGASADGKYQGTQYDQDVYYVQITVKGANGAGVRSDIQYFKNYDADTETCSDEIVPGKDQSNFFQVEDDVYRLWFHNSYTAEPVTAAIQGNKTLNGRAMKDGEFTFDLEAANDGTKAALADGSITAAEGGMTAKSPAAADGDAGSFAFPELTFNKVGTYKFRVTESIPQDAKNDKLNGVTYDKNVSTVTVTVTDRDDDNKKTGKLIATVSYENSKHDSDKLAEFINSYEEAGSYDIAGMKKITGRDFAEGDSFTFTVTPKDDKTPYPVDKDGKEVKEVTIKPDSGNSADLDFGSVNFTKAGESYEYTLKEVKPNDTKGVTYDDTVYTLTLTAKSNDPQDGKLTIEKTLKAGSSDADAIVWNNAYRPEGSLQLEGSKTLRGRSWNDDDSFNFTLWAKAEDKDRLDAALYGETYQEKDGKLIFKTVTVTKKDVADGTAAIDFGNIKFKQASGEAPFTFYITESVPDGAADGVFEGIAYDSDDHEIPVYVTDDGAGSLTATVPDSSKSNLSFTNIYTSSIAYSTHAGFVIQKTLHGRDMEDGQFTFDIKALAGVNATAADSAYKLGISRDETEKQVTSTAALDGETSTINVMKGEVNFDQDDVGKTFKCEISEVQDKNAKGYTYDTNVYQVTAEVTDNAKGEVTVVTTVRNKATDEIVSKTTVHSGDDSSQEKPTVVVPFDNHYSASGVLDGSGSAKINATKTLTGRAMKAGEFTFHVTNAKDPQKTLLLTGKNEASADGKAGDVDFAGKIEYTTESLKKDVADGLAVKEDGKYIYQYEVSEAIDNLPAGVSAEEAAFTITVEVTDNGDGTLTAAVQYPNDDKNLAFENVYDPAVEMIPIKGVKVLNNVNGGTLSIGDIEGKYEFSLTGKETTSGADADAPVPVLNGKEMTKTRNDATGEIDFGHIKLEAADFDGITPDAQGIRTRTFEYQITESGKVAGIVNDSEATKTLKLTVAYNSKEKTFSVEGVAEGAAFQFTNTYGVEAVSVDADTLFTVNKKLTGRDLKAGEFQFELLEISADGEAQVIATGTNGAASAGKSAAVDFGKITYDQPGEHDYLIREVVPAGGMDTNTEYDTRSYSVHVSVKDGGNGTLEVSSDASADKPFTFHNKQVKKSDPNGGDSSDGNGGNGGRGTKTGDTTPLGLAILLMLAAACTATLVLGLRREQVK